ncbi:MAG: hypothetical protein FWC39_10590 [Bacteroidetes bacterium]|nr:hypothetical protein [Bacteroidota bacterium]
MSIQERVIQYIDLKGITPYKFCKDLGFSMGYLDKRGAIGTDKYLKIIEYYNDINPEWLLKGNGTMLKGVESTHVAIQANDSDVKFVYLYDTSASAGYGNFNELIKSENIINKYIIPDFRDIDFMIYVKGSSMYPKYSSGDIIACRILHESKFIQWGKVYVVATREQGLLVKRLKKSVQTDHITALSDNVSYDSFDIPNDEVVGLALVVGVLRLE